MASRPAYHKQDFTQVELDSYIMRGASRSYRIRNKEHFRDVVNSYFGSFRHFDTLLMRYELAQRICRSPWGEQIGFRDDLTACYVKPRWTVNAYLTKTNKQLKSKVYGIARTYQCA